MKKRDCPGCSRLWREYETATANHVHLTGKHRMAELQNDLKNARQLYDMVEEAAEERFAAHYAIRQHEADAHGVIADANSDIRQLGLDELA